MPDFFAFLKRLPFFLISLFKFVFIHGRLCREFKHFNLIRDKVERVQRRAARFVKSRYSRYSSVSDMLDVLGWPPLSQRGQEARLNLFYKIINGLAQVPFKGVLVEAYMGSRRKHNMKFRQIGHTTSQYGPSYFPKTISAWNGLAFAEAPSLAVLRSILHSILHST